MKKRIFIGSFVKIPSFPAEYRHIKELFGSSIKGRWIPEQNFHITYRFIGDANTGQIEELKKAISPILKREIQVNIRFEGVGAFPDIYSPRVFFINVVDTEGKLQEINGYISGRLSYLGYPPEKKPFRPHVTLKRVKSFKRQEFLSAYKKYRDVDFGTQKTVEVNIIESILQPEGAVYKKLD
ncbi:RNA 2',3'-cyclic phosphodiesterase [Persephonella sp.]